MAQPWGIKYRPVDLKTMIGNESVLNRLDEEIETDSVPSRIGLFGSTGAGKTTLSYILAEHFTGKPYNPDSPSLCVHEINCASDKGIDTIRDLIETVKMSPMFGKRHVVILDEVQSLTPAASKALYKPLETKNEGAVWLLLTDQPHQLSPTLRGRLNVYNLQYPTADELIDYAEWVCKKEKCKFNEKIVTYIANTCTGNVRLFLNTLQDTVNLVGATQKEIDAVIHENIEEGLRDNLDNLLSILNGDGPIKILNAMEVYMTWQGLLVFALSKRNDLPVEENYYGNMFYNRLNKNVENRDLLSTLKALNKARWEIITGGVDGRAAFVCAFMNAE